MRLHVGDGRRDGPVTSSCDNVIAWRIGEACTAAAQHPAGDLIDRGLVLLRELEKQGFQIVVPKPRATGCPDTMDDTGRFAEVEMPAFLRKQNPA